MDKFIEAAQLLIDGALETSPTTLEGMMLRVQAYGLAAQAYRIAGNVRLAKDWQESADEWAECVARETESMVRD